MEKLIYLDNAATTKTRPEVVEAMLPYFTEYYGNPSSVYTFSAESKKAVTNAREIIAKSLGAKTNEIYFTAGGSESDNWALVATAEAYSCLLYTSQSFKTVFKVGGTVDQNGLFRFFIAADKIDDKTVCFNKIKGLKSFLCQIFLKAVLYFVDMLGRQFRYWGKAIQDQGCKIRIFPYRRF